MRYQSSAQRILVLSPDAILVYLYYQSSAQCILVLSPDTDTYDIGLPLL